MRIKKLIRTLANEKKLPYLISSLPNIFYLTGFKGSYGYLLVHDTGAFFISDSRYEEYARKILPVSVSFALQKESFPATLLQMLKSLGTKSMFIEEHSVTLSTYYSLVESLKGIKLHRGGDAVNAMRIRKEENEVAVLRKAAEITDRCMEHLLGFVKPGLTEWEIATEIEVFYRANGCSGTSFPTIVASGSGSSMPHYATSMEKKIAYGDVLLVDMGCHFEGYNSDLTRTIFIGTIDETMRNIYSVVREAQQAAVDSVRPGITAGKLDSITRGIIARHGFGEAFSHSLGHGVGLDVHEIPALRTGSKFRLSKNTVITIEPGIYIPGKGGVRIEDMVLVTEKGHEVLTKFTKDILIV